MNELDETIQNPSSFDSQDSNEQIFKQPMSKPKRGGGRSGLRQRSRLFKRLAVKQAGSLISRKNRPPRFCPEYHKLINEQKCESCKKYRHWPEGTNEEPKKCWYDWQTKPSSNEPDDSGE